MKMPIKRYDIMMTCRYEFDETTNGEWVRYKDVVPYLNRTDAVVKSNVALIKQRDELLDALLTLLGETEDSDYLSRSEQEKKVKAAIAKAKGAQHAN
jgi:hypothetical protein